jgi:type IV pilus assembly protein PilY1
MSIAGGLSSAADLNLADAPLFLASGVQPNIYFILDDSGSMWWEFLYTKEAKDNFAMWGFTATVDVIPKINTSDWRSPDRRRILNSCVGVNVLHYNPTKVYTPWVGKDDDGNTYADQSVFTAKYAPYESDSSIKNLTNTNWRNDRSGYFPWFDQNNNGRLDRYVDTNGNGRMDVFTDHNGNGEFDGWVTVDLPLLGEVSLFETELECPDSELINRDLSNDDTKDFLNEWLVAVEDMDAAEQTNFANWYSYYRKRSWVAKRALSTIIDESTARMGISVLNYTGMNKAVADVDNISTPYNSTAQSNKDELMQRMFEIRASGGTPLRRALKSAGDYFKEAPGSGPILKVADGGACQQNFAILMTDGVWNGWTSPSVGNQDANTGSPFDGGLYADTYENTLADVAMKYYKTDLQPTLPDKVPTNPQDANTAQHLVTYTVAFGVSGTLDDTIEPSVGWSGWPEPRSNNDTTIDDLRHAAYNGRGLFLNAGDPQELISSLNGAVQDIQGRDASASAVSVNTGSISSSTMLFQAEFNSQKWTGEINGIPVNLDGSLDLDNKESASKVPLHGDRTIVTYDGSAGVPFQWASLTSAQKGLLGSQNILNYTRGDRSEEIAANGIYRDRALIAPSLGPLGDIINSAPAYVGNPEFLYPDSLEDNPYSVFRQNPDGDGLSTTIGYLKLYRTPVIYAGSNDGMLHAFNVDPTIKGTAQFGLELFAYVPSQAMKHLPDIANKDYRHAYSVDGSPEVADAYFNNSWHTVLTSGMNAGGQGIFALDVTNPNAYTTEAAAAATVLWEFTDADDQDLGYTFGKPTIAKANNGQWVAIFGNGYNNTVGDDNVGGGTAVLYIVDLESGALIKKIDTGINALSAPNGLSTPTTVDSDGDYMADVVFAGDLEGNMWKFDISNADPAQWDVAYLSGTTSTPLYTACATELCSTTNRQPITVKPQIGLNKGATGYLVYFGTGTYFMQNDNQNNGLQTFYAIWDKDTATLTSLNKFHLLQQDIIEEVSVPTTNLDENGNPIISYQRATTNFPISWHKDAGLPVDGGDIDLLADTHLGWYMDLVNIEGGNTDGKGERSVSNPLLRDGSIIFVTAVPDQDPCSYGGSSWYMELNAVSGARPETPIIDIDGDGDVDEDDYIPSISMGNVASSGTSSNSLATSPICITLPNGVETCKSNTSDASILEVERDAGVLLGRWMWREL